VTAGIQASLLHWRQSKIIQDSAWDRLAQFEIALQRVGPTEAERIVTARLEHFLKPYCHLDVIKQRTHDDPLFPLGRAWRERFFHDRIDCRPREAINAARECWHRRQQDLNRLGLETWLTNGFVEPSGLQPPMVVPPPTKHGIEAAIDRKIAEKIGAHVGRQLATRGALPPDADHLAGLVARLLRH